MMDERLENAASSTTKSALERNPTNDSSEAFHKRRVTTPDDGRCMFFAIANSILIPLLDNEEEFKTEFLNLFPGHETHISYTWDFLTQIAQKYSIDLRSNGAKDILEKDVKYGFLIQNFRERTVQLMYDNLLAYPEYYSSFNVEGGEAITEEYLERMKSPEAWAGNHELCVISELLNKRIKLPSSIIQKDGQGLADTNPMVEVYYNGVNHYEAVIDLNVLTKKYSYTKSEKIQKWMDKFPRHPASGLTLISIVAYESYNLEDYNDRKLSEGEIDFLNEAFKIDLNEEPGVIRSLFCSFLSEVKEVDEEYLNSIPTSSAVFDSMIFQYMFSSQELVGHVRESSAAINSLINHDLIKVWSDDLLSKSNGKFSLSSSADEEQFSLSRVVFLYGSPLFSAINDFLNLPAEEAEGTRQGYRDLYDRMVSIEIDSSKIIEAILYYPQNLEQVFNDFSLNMAKDISEKCDGDLFSVILDMMKVVKGVYLPYFMQDNYSLFTPFKSKYVMEEMEKRAKKAEESKEEVKFEDLSGLLDDNVHNDLYKLCLELVKMHKRQELLSPGQSCGEDLLTAFSTELFKKHYYLTGVGFTNFGSSRRVNQLLSFLYEIGFSKVYGKELGSDIEEVKSYSSQLRKEIRELKTTREISQKAKEYRSSKIPRKILDITEIFLQLADDVQKIVPDNLLIYNEYIFSISEAIESAITEPHNVAKNFREKFLEIEKESNELTAAIYEELAKEIAEIEKADASVMLKSKEIRAKIKKDLSTANETKSEETFDVGNKKIKLSDCHKFKVENSIYYLFKDATVWGKLDVQSKERFDGAVSGAIANQRFAKAKGDHGIKFIESNIYEIKVAGVDRIGGSLHKVKGCEGNEVSILNFSRYCKKSKNPDGRSSNEYDEMLKQIRTSLKPD
jgi:phage anti-repressor protein